MNWPALGGGDGFWSTCEHVQNMHTWHDSVQKAVQVKPCLVLLVKELRDLLFQQLYVPENDPSYINDGAQLQGMLASLHTKFQVRRCSLQNSLHSRVC